MDAEVEVRLRQIERELTDAQQKRKYFWAAIIAATGLLAPIISVLVTAWQNQETLQEMGALEVRLESQLEAMKNNTDRLREEAASAQGLAREAQETLDRLGGVERVYKQLDALHKDLLAAEGMLERARTTELLAERFEERAREMVFFIEVVKKDAELIQPRIDAIEDTLANTEIKCRDLQTEAKQSLRVLRDAREEVEAMVVKTRTKFDSDLKNLQRKVSLELGSWSSGPIGKPQRANEAGFVLGLLRAEDHRDRRKNLDKRMGGICGFVNGDPSFNKKNPKGTAHVSLKDNVLEDSFLMPVRKGNHWLVDRCSNESDQRPDALVYWMPLSVDF